ncbi:hypothetical protein A3715_10350 [Oleiphilus sp. HI0009]|nr:hypothetical protein A3715_10350 [Oleiphilus sp. HI0009]
MPMPMQMLAAAPCAVLLKANLPLSVGLVWFSNPITMPPIFYLQYLLGSTLLGLPPTSFEYEFSIAWFQDQLYTIVMPLCLGAIISGITLATIGYFVAGALFKRKIISNWRARRNYSLKS